MVTEKEIARINELAKKQKEGTLTAEELSLIHIYSRTSLLLLINGDYK